MSSPYDFDFLIDATMLQCSGIGTYVKQLLPRIHWSAWNRVGAMCAPEDQAFIANLGIQPIVWNVGLYSPRRILGARKLPRSKALWVPHFNLPFGLPRQQKIFVTIHDLFHLDMAPLIPRTHRLYSRILLANAVSKASTILTVSQSTADRIGHYYPRQTAKIRMIHNGIQQFTTVAHAQPTQPFVLMVGNVKPHKNVRRAIAAFAIFRQKHPEFKMVIVGKADNFLNGEEALDQAGLSQNGIQFTGFVSDALLQQFYATCSCFLFPSLYEGFGLPVLEAAAQGAKVCCSNIPSLREIAQGHAIFFDPMNPQEMAHALEQTIAATPADPQSSAHWLSQYTWEHSAQQHQQVFSHEA